MLRIFLRGFFGFRDRVLDLSGIRVCSETLERNDLENAPLQVLIFGFSSQISRRSSSKTPLTKAWGKGVAGTSGSLLSQREYILSGLLLLAS